MVEAVVRVQLITSPVDNFNTFIELIPFAPLSCVITLLLSDTLTIVLTFIETPIPVARIIAVHDAVAV